MTKFRLKKIQKKANQRANGALFGADEHRSRRKKKAINASLAASFVIILVLLYLIVKVIFSIDYKSILLSAGTELEKDESGHTNFLLIGTGDKDHDGADLTDTIMVVSFSEEKNYLSIISIPRDLQVVDPETNSIRINEVFYYAKEKNDNALEGIEHLMDVVGEIADQELHYFVKIDFSGFTEIVDALGGVDIDVKDALVDPFYPKGNGFYETLKISKGTHHFDGDLALKYARSRKTTSDFDRAERQQQILKAIKEKALRTDTILNSDTLSKVLDTIKDNFQTNLSTGEILTLGAIGKDFNANNIVNKVINDNPVECGGFLYAPPIMEGEAFTFMIPGDPEELPMFFDNLSHHPDAFNEYQSIYVLNGTGKSGVAAETKQVLQRYCLELAGFSNAKSTNIEKTTAYYSPIPLPKEKPEDELIYKDPETLLLIKKLIPQVKFSTEMPQEYIDRGLTNSASIILELGKDYVNSDNFLEDEFYSLYSTIYAEPTLELDDTTNPTGTATTITPAPTTND